MVSHTAQASPPKAIVIMRCLQAPGQELARLFLPAPAPDELWVVSVPTNHIDDPLKEAECQYDRVQLLQGPCGRQDA